MTQSAEQICELWRALGGKHPLVRIMEVCGTHTMSIARSGLRGLLPKGLELISGPGCPVCVTDQSYMDQAVHLARQTPQVTIATYGDMVRVPGRNGSLAQARSEGAVVEVVYSADQAVELAIRNPSKKVVFLGVGFETTAPATALAILRAKQEGVRNFSVLGAHKLIMPAMMALLAGGVEVEAFLCPGHVRVILGYDVYKPIVDQYAKPCVVAGFDIGQVVLGIEEILRELAAGEPKACTVYSTVLAGGNANALRVLEEVFTPGDAPWRALGVIPGSGLGIRPELADFDAAVRFHVPTMPSYEMPGCRCGEVITGRLRPPQCALFGVRCTPRDPIGPCMVSSEGACSAAYKYERHE